jgi:hypothetical protein
VFHCNEDCVLLQNRDFDTWPKLARKLLTITQSLSDEFGYTVLKPYTNIHKNGRITEVK